MTHIKLFPRPTDGPLLIHIDPFTMSIYNLRIRPGPVTKPSVPRRPTRGRFLTSHFKMKPFVTIKFFMNLSNINTKIIFLGTDVAIVSVLYEAQS